MRKVSYYPGAECMYIETDRCSIKLNLSMCYPASKTWMHKLDKLFNQLIFPEEEIVYFVENIIGYLKECKSYEEYYGDKKKADKYKINIEYYMKKLQ